MELLNYRVQLEIKESEKIEPERSVCLKRMMDSNLSLHLAYL